MDEADKPPSGKDNICIGTGDIPAIGSLAKRFKGAWTDFSSVDGVWHTGNSLHTRCLAILTDIRKA